MNGVFSISGTEKRQLYGASWNAKTQTITLHPQRTKNCMEKNACIFNLSFLDDQGKVIVSIHGESSFLGNIQLILCVKVFHWKD